MSTARSLTTVKLRSGSSWSVPSAVDRLADPGAAGPARPAVHHHRAGAAHTDPAGEAIRQGGVLVALNLGDDVEDRLVRAPGYRKVWKRPSAEPRQTSTDNAEFGTFRHDRMLGHGERDLNTGSIMPRLHLRPHSRFAGASVSAKRSLPMKISPASTNWPASPASASIAATPDAAGRCRSAAAALRLRAVGAVQERPAAGRHRDRNKADQAHCRPDPRHAVHPQRARFLFPRQRPAAAGIVARCAASRSRTIISISSSMPPSMPASCSRPSLPPPRPSGSAPARSA